MLKLKLYNNQDKNRYEFHFKNDTPFLQYKIKGSAIHLIHTDVPSSLEGKGVGTELVKAVLQDLQSQGLEVVPLCPFVRGYLDQHPHWKATLNFRNYPKSK